MLLSFPLMFMKESSPTGFLLSDFLFISEFSPIRPVIYETL